MHNTNNDRLLYWQRSKLILSTSLTTSQKMVLLSVSDHMGANDHSRAGVGRHAKRTSLSERTVQRLLKQLVHDGLLTCTVRPGRPTWYALNIEKLQTLEGVTPCHPCHGDGGDTVSGAGDIMPGAGDIMPGAGDTMTPKGEQEGGQGRRSRKETNKNSKSKALSIQDVQGITPPQELTDALPGYRDAFAAWCEVRKGTSWRQKPAQVVSFHGKMLKAHNDGLDVMAALGKAFDAGWQGINASYMQPLTVKRDTKRTPALQKDLKAQYRAYLLGELNK